MRERDPKVLFEHASDDEVISGGMRFHDRHPNLRNRGEIDECPSEFICGPMGLRCSLSALRWVDTSP